MGADLPAHSKLGASSSERWMACPGSVALADLLALDDDDPAEEPEYRREGIEAHRLAAHCLEQGLDVYEVSMEDFPTMTPEMGDAVQEYVSYVREQPGEKVFERRVHLPEFHPLFYGTLDCRVWSEAGELAIIDYKHGVGVVVEPDWNTQTMYYAWGEIALHRDWPDEMSVSLTIVQPRAYHADGSVRTWVTNVGAIREWAMGTLLPAMERVAVERYLQPGEHCRFCNAKLVCPAMQHALGELAQTPVEALTGVADDKLGRLYELWNLAMMMGKPLKEEIIRRALRGGATPGAKVVWTRTDRAWKEEAEARLIEKYGDGLTHKTELISPAQAEKLPGGRDFVAEYAFKPLPKSYTVARESDQRKPAKITTAKEVWASALDELTS